MVNCSRGSGSERINEGVDIAAAKSEQVMDHTIKKNGSSQVIVVSNLLFDTGA